MARDLKADTAVTIVVGPIIYATAMAVQWPSYDVTQLDCGIKKAGTAGAAITLTASGGNNDMTDCANNPGHYDLELTAGNVDTEGPLRLTFNASDIAPFYADFNVICSDAWAIRYTDGTLASADSIVDAWETQSQSDPTGFHVNVLEVNGTAQTANDNGADINAILVDTGTSGVVLAADSVNATAVAAGAIAAGDLAAGAVTAGVFAANAIDATALAATAVDEIWDEVLHNSQTARQLLGILLPAFAAGKATGGGTTSITFRDTADGFDAIVQTVDENGNRSTVTTAFA